MLLFMLYHKCILENIVLFLHIPSQERTASRADVDDEEEEDDSGAQQAQEFLDLLKEDREENSGGYTGLLEHHLCNLL